MQISGALLAILPAFQLDKEFNAAQTVAKRLEGDLYTRIGASILTAGVIAWSGMVTIALVWSICVFINEAIEPFVVRQLMRNKEPSAKRLLLYTLHMVSGSAVWAGASVALWMTHDPAIMALGAVLLLGTLMHVTLIYSISRLLVLSVSAPLVIVMGILALMVVADDGIATRDKTIVIISVLILLVYLVLLLFTNIETQEEMAKLSEENARFAREDTLTQLANRRHFVESIQTALDSAAPFAIAFIDLDQFKPLNDEYGHAIGDEALKAVAQRLKSCQSIDSSARLGGDEFGVLISSPASLNDLAAVLEDLWETLVDTIDTSIGPISLGASIGCVRNDEALCDHSKLMHAADIAMIRVKSEGGGVAIFDASIDARLLESAEIEGAFRTAVRAGQISAALQPIKCVASQTVKKFELLARWERADGGPSLTPHEFIPLAERLGLLNQILWSTLEQALPLIRGTGFTLAINISPSQLTAAKFFANLESRLRQHLIPNSQIEIEITEQVAFRNDKENLAHLKHARDAGFSIVLDDFGTGYSSISLLDQLPLDKVKLDHTFVQSAIETDHGRKLLSAIVGLLKQMDLRCCIEGIETSDAEKFVSDLGCEEVQGYLIGKPEIVRHEADENVSIAI